MALSDREREVLEQLEKQLNSEDPSFAESMAMPSSTGPSFSFNIKNIVLGILTAAVGLAVLLTGVTINQIWLGVAGFILIAAGAFLTFKRGSSAKKHQTMQPKSTQAESGFMQNLERRWDERNSR